MKRNNSLLLVALLTVALCALCVSCSEPSASKYKVGDTGPAGGIIVYDAGEIKTVTYSVNGQTKFYRYRYIEVAPEDIEVQFGYYCADDSTTDASQATQVVTKDNFVVGTGMANTDILVSTMNGHTYEKATKSKTTLATGEEKEKTTFGAKITDYAVTKCDSYSYGGYDDWFMPSMAELLLCIPYKDQLKLTTKDNGCYMSSTESGGFNVQAYSFVKNTSYNAPRLDGSTAAASATGTTGDTITYARYVRPIRYFTGE